MLCSATVDQMPGERAEMPVVTLDGIPCELIFPADVVAGMWSGATG